MLPSLEIKNFRAFKHLTIEKLAQINLITGKNNVGKTTLLEAINLFRHKGSPHTIRNIGDDSFPYDFLKHLFYSYDITQRISISGENDNKLIILIGDPEYKTDHILSIKLEGEEIKRIPIELFTGNFKQSIHSEIVPDKVVRCFIVPSLGINQISLCRCWDELVLTNLEEDVVTGLQLINSSIEKIGLVATKDGENERFFRVRLNGLNDPISLYSLGSGINRDFEIILSMVSSKDGTLLIDEVENCLHYSIQPHVWKLIFELAKRLNVQVFATTHSWDCISAFQETCSQYQDVDSQLIRLTRKNDKILTSIFTPEDLKIVTKERIEVR